MYNDFVLSKNSKTLLSKGALRRGEIPSTDLTTVLCNFLVLLPPYIFFSPENFVHACVWTLKHPPGMKWIAVTSCRVGNLSRGGKGQFSEQQKNKCVFNKLSAPCAAQQTLSLFLCRSGSNERVEVEGPWRVPGHLEKPFKGSRLGSWSCWGERKWWKVSS